MGRRERRIGNANVATSIEQPGAALGREAMVSSASAAEAQVAHSSAWQLPIAQGGLDSSWQEVAPATATAHARRRICRGWTGIGRRGGGVARIAISGPLPDVSCHVQDAKRTGPLGKAADWRCGRPAVITLVGPDPHLTKLLLSHCHTFASAGIHPSWIWILVTPGVLATVIAAGGEFPFGLSRQAATRPRAVGCPLLPIHAVHGVLIHVGLSPVTKEAPLGPALGGVARPLRGRVSGWAGSRLHAGAIGCDCDLGLVDAVFR